MKDTLIIIVGLSILLFFIITIVRVVMMIVLKFTINKYMKLLALIRPKDKIEESSNPSNINDVLYRDKDLEKKKEYMMQKQQEAKLVNVQRLPSEREVEPEINYNKKNIVGIVKPIGYWTSLVMGQKVIGLMQHAEILRQQNDSGYWVNMIHAQRAAMGKDKGRGV